MKTFFRVNLAILALMTAATSTWAQGADKGITVALLDVGYIFKNHPGFTQKMDAMKEEVKRFEAQLQVEQQKIEQAGRQISALTPGSADYKQLEETTTKQLADVKLQMQFKRKEIMEREAQIYMDTYKEVSLIVESFSKKVGIDMVLRYDREAEPTEQAVSPQDTLKIINRPVIYQAKLDISDQILKGIVQSAQRTQPQRR